VASLEVLSQHLPEEAEEIHRHCNGMQLVPVSISDRGNSGPWSRSNVHCTATFCIRCKD
jgi:hypothetical protein